jgi:pyruvate formate lyase activating enzyme
MSILVTNIQRFSLHDGPGIRTTVFLKGCSLRCPWCSNPENLLPNPQEYYKDGIPGTYGKYYEAEELVRECLKDQSFYDGKITDHDSWNITSADQIKDLPGGVTFSGGEALLRMKELAPACESLHSENVHVAVETCLFVPEDLIDLALKHIDFFYIDIKILDEKRAEEVLKGSLGLFYKNFEKVMSWKDDCGRHKTVVIRIPVIGSYTDDPENRRAVKQLIGKYTDSILKIELIKEHNLGESKYKSLNMEPDYHGVDDSLMEQYRDELSDMGIMTEICKI